MKTFGQFCLRYPLRMTSQKICCQMVTIIFGQVVSRRQTMKASKTIYQPPSINATRLVTQVPVICFHVTLSVRYCLTSGPHPDHWFVILKEKFDDVTLAVAPVEENSCVYIQVESRVEGNFGSCQIDLQFLKGFKFLGAMWCYKFCLL